jgi:hypothetical protein
MLAPEKARNRQRPEARPTERPQECRGAGVIAANDDTASGAFRLTDGLLPARSPGITLVGSRQGAPPRSSSSQTGQRTPQKIDSEAARGHSFRLQRDLQVSKPYVCCGLRANRPARSAARGGLS